MSIPKKRISYTWQYEGNLTIQDLMEQYYSNIGRLAYAILKDHDDAEDAVQETFIRAAVNLNRYRGASELKTWLFAIAINVCRGELRKRKARHSLMNVLKAFGMFTTRPISVEERTVQNEAKVFLWQEVARLDEKHRLPVILRYIDRMSVSEISQILDVPEGTIHSRLYYARQKLANRLGNNLD